MNTRSTLGISLVALTLAFAFTGCRSRSVLPDAKEVKVSRDEPGKDCKELGKIMGRVTTKTGTREQALEDLKREAANKGANYVTVKQYSDNGTAVTGIAYECM